VLATARARTFLTASPDPAFKRGFSLVSAPAALITFYQSPGQSPLVAGFDGTQNPGKIFSGTVPVARMPWAGYAGEWLATTAGSAGSMVTMPDKSAEQKDAEAEVEGFQQDLGPFVVAAETTRMAMVFTDAKHRGDPIIFANDAFLALTGYAREEVLGQPFNFLMADDSDAGALKRTNAEFEAHPAATTEILYRRKDGSEFWAALFASPVRDKSGAIVQYFTSFVDLTRHKEEQAQSKMFIDELNHRVKNMLATVQSIVWQASRANSDPKVIRDAVEARLFALSRSHNLLTRENWHSAGLLDILHDALEPFGVTDGRAERLVITGENIRLSTRAALALGIALNSRPTR
jgi:PAS domain S-box-containing protein